MPRARKNLVIFYADQLRQDCLGCYGNPVARTPHLDRLAERGVRFDNHYANNPVCMPSRASFFTGRYLQAHRVLDNGLPLSEKEITIAHVLAGAGYVSHSVGKIHLTPYRASRRTGCPESREVWQSGALDNWNGPYFGFQTVELTLGHGEAAFRHRGHYGTWVRQNFPHIEQTIGPENASGPLCEPLGCWRSGMPPEAHHSTWVADRAVRFLETRGDRPFFLFVSFPDPHHPFTPPAQYARIFDGCRFPGPYRLLGENDTKPEQYRRAMQRREVNRALQRPSALTDQTLQMVQENTYGMIAFMDECIGRVLKKLEDSGLAENTTIVFTADHGEFLGDHHLLYKGPFPCRSLLRIPCILADPDLDPLAPGAIMSNVDLMPTLLDLLHVPVPDGVQGLSFAPYCKGLPPEPRQYALASGWLGDLPDYYHHSLYSGDARISYFPNLNDGELYDLSADPHEHRNLFHDGHHAAARDRMLLALLRAVTAAEPPSIGQQCPW